MDRPSIYNRQGLITQIIFPLLAGNYLEYQESHIRTICKIIISAITIQ